MISFELGGDSLLGTQFISQLNRALGSRLSLHDFFEQPRISALAACLEPATSTSRFVSGHSSNDETIEGEAPPHRLALDPHSDDVFRDAALGRRPGPVRAVPPARSRPDRDPERSFEPAVEALARLVETGFQTRPSDVRAPGRLHRPDEIPLSFAQRRLWFLDRLEGSNPAHTIPIALRLTGGLDTAALTAALGDVVARHESLRTVFPETQGSPRQLILEPGAARPRLAVTPVSEAELDQKLTDAARQGIDLASDLPLRAHLFVLGPQEHVLLLVLHHIASDGWSLAPLGRDLATAYRARCRQQAPDLPPLPVQYADFTLWQYDVLGREDDPDSAIARQLEFWTQTLKGLPDQLDLPTDRPRPAVSSHRGDSVAVNINLALHGGLLALARENQASLFMVLQAGLAALLTRLGAGTDIPIGSPIAGRTDSALDDLVGFFVNTLVLRTDTAGNPSFRDLIRRVRAVDLAAYEHQDLPFERLVEVLNPARSLARHPLFQVMLAFQNTDTLSLDLAGVSVTSEPLRRTGANVRPLTRPDSHARRRHLGRIVGHSRIQHRSVPSRHGGNYRGPPPAFARGRGRRPGPADRPAGHSDARRAPHDSERLEQHRPRGWPLLLPQLFADQATRTPDAVAAMCGEQVLSYAELDARANQLAHHLQSLSVGPDSVVGIFVDRSLDMLIGLLGVLKAGGAYLPLDPSHPAERLAYILADARTSVLLTQAALRVRLPAHAAYVVCLDADAAAINVRSTTAPAVAIHPGTLLMSSIPLARPVSRRELSWSMAAWPTSCAACGTWASLIVMIVLWPSPRSHSTSRRLRSFCPSSPARAS